MKRSKILCYGLLLALVTIFGSFLNVSSDVNALKHEYNGIALFDSIHPCNFEYDSSTNKYVRSRSFNNDPNNLCGGTSGFSLYLEGDASSLVDNLRFTAPSSQLNLSNNYDSESNKYIIDSFQSDVSPILSPTTLSSPSFTTTGFYIPSFFTDVPTSSLGYLRQPLISSGVPSVDISSLSDIANVVPCDNGVPCGFPLNNQKQYIQGNVLPYRYSYDGFMLHSSAVDTDSGLHYSHTFSLSDVFNSYIPGFSFLQVPLSSYDDYFYTPSNFYQGREIEFKGVFDFDGSFDWHQNISTNGSYFRVYYDGVLSSDPTDTTNSSGYFDCSTNLRTGTDPSNNSFTQLEYSCPYTLPYDFSELHFRLEISGNGNYVWLTDDDWRFMYSFLVTDNDETPGQSFNSDLTGGGQIPGNAENDITGGETDWFSSLFNLFSFDFINPFAPIFNLFNNDSCAQIPTLASMLHSQETQVCPWFDSTVRNITTPVLGLASMMLVFGFVVRWLGSRSGNFIEDSGGIDSGGYHFENKYRRKK